MLGSLGGDLVWPLLERIVDGDGQGPSRRRSASPAQHLVRHRARGARAILHRVALAQAGAGRRRADASACGDGRALDAGRVQVMYQIALLGGATSRSPRTNSPASRMALLRMLSFARRVAAGRGPRPRRRASPSAARRADAAPRRRRRRPQPRPPRAAAATFDGDWPRSSRAQLTGMAGMLARYARARSFENNHLELVVPESAPHVREKPTSTSCRRSSRRIFGRLRLSVRVGTTAASSSRRAQRARATSARRARAERSRTILSCEPGARPRRRGGASSIRPPEGAATSERG
jgi:hypothetical protein